MGKQRLDERLLSKIETKIQKSKQYIREKISRRAARDGISAEAAQVLLAKQYGIGTSSYFRNLPAYIQQEVRGALQAGDVASLSTTRANVQPKRAPARKAKFEIKSVVDETLKDKELRDRCRDLLSAGRHYDRVLREATTVLDNRLKKLSGVKNLNPAPLVGKVLNGDPARAVIVVSPEANEQQGFHNMCSGVMLAFRDNTHHNLSDSFTQSDALKFCGMIDILLAVIGKGTVYSERVNPPAAAARAGTI
jgi:hypothetical protein